MRVRWIFCFLLAVSLSFVAHGASSSQPGAVKEWHFDAHGGELQVWLAKYATSPDLTLALSATGEGAPTTSEAQAALRQVLADMARGGYDPRRLIMINMPLQISGLEKQIASEVLKSGTWKKCIKLKYCYRASSIIEGYLKSVDAFREFDDLLRPYGLKRLAIRTDEVSVRMEGGHLLCDGTVLLLLHEAHDHQ